MPDFIALLNTVHGFLTLAEAELLYHMACNVPENGNIVEIGAYQGRSTIALALGAMTHRAQVWSIDPHTVYDGSDTSFNMADNQCYYANLAQWQVGSVVKTVNMASFDLYPVWMRTTNTISLLWIDGSHDYESVKEDFVSWSRLVPENGKIAMHDTAGHHAGISRLVDEILAAGVWIRTEQVDAISIFTRRLAHE